MEVVDGDRGREAEVEEAVVIANSFADEGGGMRPTNEVGKGDWCETVM